MQINEAMKPLNRYLSAVTPIWQIILVPSKTNVNRLKTRIAAAVTVIQCSLKNSVLIVLIGLKEGRCGSPPTVKSPEPEPSYSNILLRILVQRRITRKDKAS